MQLSDKKELVGPLYKDELCLKADDSDYRCAMLSIICDAKGGYTRTTLTRDAGHWDGILGIGA